MPAGVLWLMLEEQRGARKVRGTERKVVIGRRRYRRRGLGASGGWSGEQAKASPAGLPYTLDCNL